MRKRVLILPISAAVIIAMCAYRISTNDPNAPKPIAPTANYRPAPEFELYDQHEPSETVRLEGYLGRHTIVIVFFDAKIGADRDPILARLRQDFDKIKSSGTKVFAISTALPQDNRKVIQQQRAVSISAVVGSRTGRAQRLGGQCRRSAASRRAQSFSSIAPATSTGGKPPRARLPTPINSSTASLRHRSPIIGLGRVLSLVQVSRRSPEGCTELNARVAVCQCQADSWRYGCKFAGGLS